MGQVLASRAWQTPLPIPTVELRDNRWKSDAFWRSDVWPPTNDRSASSLAAYGYGALAADLCDKAIANALQHGISAHHDSITGKGLGVPDYCVSYAGHDDAG